MIIFGLLQTAMMNKILLTLTLFSFAFFLKAQPPAGMGKSDPEAKKLLEADWGVGANVWSCPSFNELARDGQNAERWNLLHPTELACVPYVTQQLSKVAGPVIASTDYMKNYAEQIRAYIPQGRSFKVLGTDGFGRSDFRYRLREHFATSPPPLQQLLDIVT